MSFISWFRGLQKATGFARARRSRLAAHQGRTTSPLVLEPLEDRTLPSTFTVTNLLDDGSAGSLRWAINQVNTDTDPQSTILFNIVPSGIQTIAVSSALPAITHPVTIDGTSERGYAGTPLLALNGSQAGVVDGLVMEANYCTIKGLDINNFAGNGIRLSSASYNTITANYIGTDPTGTQAAPNGYSGIPTQEGIEIDGNSDCNLVGNDGGGIGVASGGNLISANGQSAIVIWGPSQNNVVAGNLIGTTAAGNAPLGNGGGVGVDSGGAFNRIEYNVICANPADGINIANSANDNVVADNYIGTDITGTIPMGNGDAVRLFFGAGNTVTGNTIEFNHSPGVSVEGDGSSVGNTIRGNSIYANGGLGIDLGNNGATLNDSQGHAGPNNWQNFPVLSAALSGSNTAVVGVLASTPFTTFMLDFYGSDSADASGFGQGQFYLGSATATTDSQGNASFQVLLPAATAAGEFISATATDPAGNTSEFSQDILASANVPLTATKPSTVAISSSGPSVIGQQVTLVAAVAPSASNTGTPTGTVEFQINGVAYGNPLVPLVGGTARISFRPPAVGNYTIMAIYSGDSVFLPSNSSGFIQTVDPAPTILNDFSADNLEFHPSGVLPLDPAGNPTSSSGSPIDFYANPIGGPFPETDAFAWSVQRNGASYPLPAGTVANASFFRFTPDDSGTFLVTLAVTDSENATFDANMTIDVTDTAPTTIITPVTPLTLAGGIQLDPSFGYGGETIRSVDPGYFQWEPIAPLAMAVQPDGKILVAGFLPATSAGGSVVALARYDSSGILDPTFGPNQTGWVTTNIDSAQPWSAGAVAVQPDGKIVVGGQSPTESFLVRYDSAGNLDTSFGPVHDGIIVLPFMDAVQAVDFEGDCEVIAGGAYNSHYGSPYPSVVAVSAAGAVDWESGNWLGNGVVTDLEVQPDGGILAGSQFGEVLQFWGPGIQYPFLQRLDSLGNPTFSVNFDNNTNAVVQPDGKILYGGASFLRRLNADGTLDTGFGLNGSVELDMVPSSLVLQADGKIVVAGGDTPLARFNAGGGDTLARFNADGSPDTTFAPGGEATFALSAPIDKLLLQPDGNLIALLADNRVARFTAAPAPTHTPAGTAIQLNSLVRDPSTADAQAGFAYTWSVTKDGQPYSLPPGTGTNADSFTFTPEDAGTYVVTFTATDKNDGAGSDSLTYLVDDVPPTAHITQAAAGSGANQVNLTLTAADPATAVQQAGFTYSINWGDGTAVQTISAAANNGTGVQTGPHTFAGPGEYTVQVTATDKNGGVSQTATAVLVVSTAGNDQVTLSGGTSAGQVVIATSTNPATTFSPTDLVFVSGQSGTDTYTVNFGSTLTTPITISGAGSASGDTLIVNGDGSATNTINKTPGQITWGNPVTETVFRSGIPNTVINANGTSQNYVNDPGGNTTINGGPGANTITITATAGNGVVINGGPSTNTYVIDLGSLAAPVTINSSQPAASNNLTVNSASGNNIITASGSQVTAGSQTINVSAPLANLAVNGGSGNNQITVANLTVPVQNMAVSGGGGNNTVTLVNVGSSVSTLTVTGSSGSGTTQVQVQGSLPPTVQAQTNVAPVVGAGNNVQAKDGLTWTSTGSFTPSTRGQSFTATVSYGDGTGTQSLALNADHSFVLRHAYANAGTYTVTVTVSDGQGRSGTGTINVVVYANVGVLLLDPSTKGALTLSGNGRLAGQGPEAVIVNSRNAQAAVLSGNASVAAEEFDVTGNPGVALSGGANLQAALHAAIAALADPLATLPVPAPPIPTFAAVSAGGSTVLTLQPGTYVGGINLSGSAVVTLQPGLYYLQGGGLTVSGQASLTGTGVFIYNAPQGTSDGVNISGQGSVLLSPPTSGTYQMVTLFQARTSAAPINITGKGDLSVSGTLYAAGAVINVSGNATLESTASPLNNPTAELIADDLKVSGNGRVAVGQPIAIQQGQSAAASFWHSAAGQQLVTSFNGGASATALSSWLTNTFANLYGSGAGSNNLIGMTNTQVAAYFQALFANGSQTVQVQALNAALNVYATTLSLGGTTPVPYGFLVTYDGVGAAAVNVGANGSAFGVANNSTLTVFQLLQAANKQTKNGVFYNSNASLDAQALNVFSNLNSAGGLG